MIKYTLLIIFALCSLYSCVVPNYSVKKYAIIDNLPKNNHNLVDIQTKKEFDPLLDEDIIIYIALEDRGIDYKIKFKWIKPDGFLFDENEEIMKQPGRYSWIYSTKRKKTLSLAEYPGLWRFEVWIDNVLAKSTEIMIIEQNKLLSDIRIFKEKFKFYKAGIEFLKPKLSSVLESLDFEWNEKFGVVVERIIEKSPAQKAGIESGDIIININDNKIYTVEEALDSIAYSLKPGKTDLFLFRPKTRKYLNKEIKLECIENIDLLLYNRFIDDFYQYRSSPENFNSKYKMLAKERAKIEPYESKNYDLIEMDNNTSPPISSNEKPRQDNTQRWAVIIGISKYKDTRVTQLRYADSDAKAFYNWIISEKGGKHSVSNVKLLLNKEATGENIKNALFLWLRQAIEEDVITIYFAGHGSPDSPDTPSNLFLLPYDTKYDKIATTGFPMWDIETAIKRYIKSKKVIIIADACHSGGVGQFFDIKRRDNRSVQINMINNAFQDLSKISDGVCVISASNDRQFSQEGFKWGGGHGVFTYYLLKGLKGEADYNNDKWVSLGEIIPFVSEKVRRETLNAQAPIVSGKFDPALSISN